MKGFIWGLFAGALAGFAVCETTWRLDRADKYVVDVFDRTDKLITHPSAPTTAEADPTAEPTAVAADVTRQLVAACQAADAYLHTWPGPLPPEARPLCDQLVQAVGAALAPAA